MKFKERCGGEDVIFEVIAGFKFGVVAFDRNSDGSARGEIRGKRHFQVHGDVERTAEVDGIGGVLRDVGHADGEERHADFGFLAGPVKIICLSEVQLELERFCSV